MTCAKACSKKNVNQVNGISNSNKNTKIIQILLNKISIEHRAKLCDSSYWCYTHVTFRKTQAVEQVEQRYCQHRNISALCKLRKFWPPHGAPATRERPSTMEHPATPDPQRTRNGPALRTPGIDLSQNLASSHGTRKASHRMAQNGAESVALDFSKVVLIVPCPWPTYESNMK